MNLFPLVDPIPLPAPIWLFKVLHVLTLALHFVAVKILLGGLLIATLLSVLGKSNQLCQSAAVSMSGRLPLVMTYVINLGVPPLLFAQVLYGPALYTSNVLIGLYWISIVFLLMACYWFLYGFADGVAAGKAVWWKGVTAWILACCISRIFSTNMAVMIKPEVWGDMYSVSAFGNNLPPFDATLTPRWLFMLFGAGWVSGLWMVWIAGRKNVQAPLNRFLAGWGGASAAGMVILQIIIYHQFLKLQPSVVMDAITSNSLLNTVLISWYAVAGTILLFALWAVIAKPCSYAAGYLAAALTFVSILSWTILRDGIRDFTLSSKGFDVWQQSVVTNWQVVGVFLLVFGMGIVALVWLISVMMRAKPIVEGGLS